MNFPPFFLVLMAQWQEYNALEARIFGLFAMGLISKVDVVGIASAMTSAPPRLRPMRSPLLQPSTSRDTSYHRINSFGGSHNYYKLELHHLKPGGNLHIAVFITLCDTYLGMEPHFNLW
jgi:hypothetical protein